MATVRNTVEVPLPVDQVHGQWLAFTGQATSRQAGTGDHLKEEVPADRVVGEAPKDDKGTISFDAVSPERTRVTMELRCNPKALADAGHDNDWVSRRIGMYLERFKEATGARPNA